MRSEELGEPGCGERPVKISRGGAEDVCGVLINKASRGAKPHGKNLTRRRGDAEDVRKVLKNKASRSALAPGKTASAVKKLGERWELLGNCWEKLGKG